MLSSSHKYNKEAKMNPFNRIIRHCERSEAIQDPGLLRYARNDNPTTVEQVDLILTEALTLRASDIHFDPFP
jgi:type II secretory ATPase GspE/PulE/Tfp pilus assembly ATPase PilB-like protein